MRIAAPFPLRADAPRAAARPAGDVVVSGPGALPVHLRR